MLARAALNDEETARLGIVESGGAIHHQIDEERLQIVTGLEQAEVAVGRLLRRDRLGGVLLPHLAQEEGAGLNARGSHGDGER